MFEMSVIYDIAIVALRILMPVYAIVIVYQCYAAMRRHRRPEKPLVTLLNLANGIKIPVTFWENSIGRSRGSDIVVNDPSVSRNHCVLLRRAEGWFISDTGSKGGTFVNGELIEERTKILIDDVIQVGASQFAFKRGEAFDERMKHSWFFGRTSRKPVMATWKLMILITLFHFFMCVEAAFWQGEDKPYSPVILFACLAVVEWTFYIVSTVVLKRINFEMESLALFLTGIGVMLLVRQVERSAYVQLVASVIGMILFCIIIKFIENPDKACNKKLRYILMVSALGLLALSIVFGRVTNGAANWISIGGISVQPSEIVKIIYIFIGASTLDRLQTKKNLLEFIIFSAMCVGLLALMGDFGTALIFFVTFLLISFMRSGDIATVILAVVAAVFGASIVLRFKSYVLDRFAAWRHCWEYANDLGYQQVHVLTAIASGGLFGVGIGNGFLKIVAASESDLVFGLVAEEMGVIVAITLAVAVACLMFYARAITTRSRSTFYSISACCAAGLLVIQLSLNVFGATDILPLTGVTFPFISCGGSSVLSCWGLIAFIKAADERTYAIKK